MGLFHYEKQFSFRRVSSQAEDACIILFLDDKFGLLSEWQERVCVAETLLTISSSENIHTHKLKRGFQKTQQLRTEHTTFHAQFMSNSTYDAPQHSDALLAHAGETSFRPSRISDSATFTANSTIAFRACEIHLFSIHAGFILVPLTEKTWACFWNFVFCLKQTSKEKLTS